MYVRYILVGLDGYFWNCLMGNVLVFKKKKFCLFLFIWLNVVFYLKIKKIIKGCYNLIWFCKFFFYLIDLLGVVLILVIDWILKKFKNVFY